MPIFQQPVSASAADGAEVTISATWSGKAAAGTNTNSIVKITDVASAMGTFSLWLDTGSKYIPIVTPHITWAELSDGTFGASLSASAATYDGVEFFITDYNINVISNGTRWLLAGGAATLVAKVGYNAAAGGGIKTAMTAVIPAGLAQAGDYWEIWQAVEKSGTSADSTTVGHYIGSTGSAATDTAITTYTGLTGADISEAQDRKIMVASATTVIDLGHNGLTPYSTKSTNSMSSAVTVASMTTNDTSLSLGLTPGATDDLDLQVGIIKFSTPSSTS